jgi:hypothetical protein
VKVVFNGRKAGAIGRTYQIVAEISNNPAENYEACQLELYNMGYDNIMFIEKYIPEYSNLLDIEQEST